ncbi:MAG TPA: hypothetical protein ENK20_00350, partial [Chromatiales bacterium]|nr:hypothetical protein [Chromatiales bacterium]
ACRHRCRTPPRTSRRRWWPAPCSRCRWGRPGRPACRSPSRRRCRWCPPARRPRPGAAPPRPPPPARGSCCPSA